MPGHKGKNLTGIEKFDVTEISGADKLFFPKGIIKESELNAEKIFGAKTFYSAEGSSPCVKAMLYLAVKHKKNDADNTILAARNVHRSFTDAAALLGFNTVFLYPEENGYVKCVISPEKLYSALISLKKKPCAVYITSPDYSGNIADVKGLKEVCEKFGVPLLVDAAHGAYLKFLPKSQYPTDLGADMCCSSAHKTLPALTGAAYLHINENADKNFSENADLALSLFCSTSPSYLILRSLDYLNKILSEDYAKKTETAALRVKTLKETFIKKGLTALGEEPLKITLAPKSFGYTGTELKNILTEKNIECEFADDDLITFMFSPFNRLSELKALEKIIKALPKKEPITTLPPKFSPPKIKTDIRTAFLLESETIPVALSKGRILSYYPPECPPAIPIALGGEVIDEKTVKSFIYYGIETVSVLK